MEEHDDLSAASWEAAYQEELQAEEEGLKHAWDGLLATRVVEGHVGTPSIPTPEAEFTHPRKLEEAHIMSIGEDPTHREVDALTPHSKPRAKRGTWDKGPPSAATDVQGKSRDIRQPPAAGEGVVAVEASVVARLQAEKVTAPTRGPPAPCHAAPARTPTPRRPALATCHAFKSRSPKEISELFYFAMAHPDLDVDVPQDLARRSADLARMRVSDWQKCRATLYSYMGQNVLAILADFDAQYIRTPGNSKRPTS